MKTVISLSREKLLGLALVVLAIIVGSWAIYYFGPRPEKRISSQAPTNQPITAPSPKQQGVPQTPGGGDLFDALFKASTTPMASGRAGDSPAKYIESLEAIYSRRGYKRIAVERSNSKSPEQRINQLREKLFWRTEAGGISTIAAWGEDADPNREIAKAANAKVLKQMYLTTVSPAEGGGTQWTTYLYLADTSQLQAFNNQLQSDSDWPGQDPPEVPRPSGLKRLVSLSPQSGPETGQKATVMVVYESQQRAELLAAWYMKEMPLAGWRLHPMAGESKENMPGVFHFIKSHRTCLVWITPGAGKDPTSVIISARAL
jgi:hypothetical protein